MDVEAEAEKKLKQGETTVVLRPVLSVAEGRVVAYYAVAIRRRSDGSILKGPDLIGRGVDEDGVDQAALITTIKTVLPRALKKAHESSLLYPDTPVIIPVNAVALDIQSVASEFTAICRQMDPETKSVVVFEVGHFPKTTSLETVDDIAILLYSFCRFYIARPNFGQFDFKVFSNTNFQGVVLDLRNRPWPMDKAEPVLRKFFAAADRYRLATYLHGAGSTEIFDVAKDCPYEFVDGDGVPTDA